MQPLDQGAVKYLLQPMDCGDKSETHTVREWLSGFDIALEDEAFLLWNQSLCQFSQILQELEKKWDMMTMMVIWFITRVALYENYDHNTPFLPQLEENIENLKLLLSDIPKLKEMVNRGTGRT